MPRKLLNSKLRALTAKIRDKTLRNKVIELLENPTFELNGESFPSLTLDIAPAGMSHHHAYPGGYVEHVVSTASIALALSDSVENVYHGKVNRDVVIACILLHDIFKPATYALNKTATYRATRLADYLDHLSLAVSELVRRDFPLEVVHAVSAHHGEYGPIRPHTVEALICHLADLADSRLNGEILNAAAFLTRKAVGQELLGLTSKEAFEIIASKKTEGEEGVAETFKKLKHERETRKT